jgi:hypothetical protein
MYAYEMKLELFFLDLTNLHEYKLRYSTKS